MSPIQFAVDLFQTIGGGGVIILAILFFMTFPILLKGYRLFKLIGLATFMFSALVYAGIF